MRKRALFGDVAHEHGDGAADGLIDIDDEHFLIVPKENGAPAARRQNCPHLDLDHRFVHRVNSTCAKRKHKLCTGYRSFITWTYASEEDFHSSGLECSAR